MQRTAEILRFAEFGKVDCRICQFLTRKFQRSANGWVNGWLAKTLIVDFIHVHPSTEFAGQFCNEQIGLPKTLDGQMYGWTDGHTCMCTDAGYSKGQKKFSWP